jgi:hypothetical protein
MSDISKMLIADGWDDCLIGVGTQFTADGPKVVAVYDRDKMVKRLAMESVAEEADDAGMSKASWDAKVSDAMEEADEYITFNVEGAYAGPGMPVFLTRMTIDQVRELAEEAIQ